MVAVMPAVQRIRFSRWGLLITLVLAGVLLFGPSPLMAAEKADPMVGSKPAGGSPLLYIDEASFQMGTVPEGAPVRHTIRIRNRGKAPLKLLRFRRWQGSRLVSADRELAPGAGGTIVLEITTLNSGPRPVRGVTFQTNEAGRSLHRIALHLEVTPQISVSPERVYLEGITGQSPSQSVRIAGNLTEPLVLTEAGGSACEAAEVIAHTLSPASRSGEYRLTVRSRLCGTGTGRTRLLFKTNYPQKPMLIVPVMVRLRDAVQVVPEQIDFGRVVKSLYLPVDADNSIAAKQPEVRPAPQAKLFVRINRPGTLQIERVASAMAEGFAAALTPVEAGKSYCIDITARVGRLPEGITEGELTICTDDPGQPILRVPLRIDVVR